MLMTEEAEMVRQGLQNQTVLVFICGQDATVVPTGDADSRLAWVLS